MVQVASVDYPNKRIYLHPDTAVDGFDCIAAYFEILAIDQINANDEQGFTQGLRGEGRVPKGGGRFTARYGVLTSGWEIVPHDADHELLILVEIISEDGFANREVFNRGLLSPGVEVDIDNAFDQVEIIEINTGGGGGSGGLTAADRGWIQSAITTLFRWPQNPEPQP